MPFVLALLSSVLYGAADFLGGLGSRRAPVVTVTALSQAAGLVVLLAAAPFVPGATRVVDLAWAAGAGLSGGAGVLLLYRALATGVVSTAAPLISMIALTVPVAVGLLAGERPGVLPMLGVAAGVGAVLLIAGGSDPHAGDGPAGPRPSRPAPLRSLAPAYASGLLIGAFLVCLGRIGAGASLWPLVAARAVGTLGLFATGLAWRVSFRPAAAAVGPIVGAGSADVVANLLYVFAVQRAPLSLIATLVSLAPASTVVLAQLVLRERLSSGQRAGVALALVAVVLLAQAR
ncbi:MAG TPA: DMT family transporter [Candidatus Eisenbacteria bacterium]|jgi:drug/metabolite transporter (DMT)-like permease